MPRILGIDPGIRKTGYGIVDVEGSVYRHVASGMIKPDPAAPIEERLLRICSELTRIIEREKPDRAAIENVFYHRNPRSMLILGQAQAAALLAMAQADLPVAHYAPTEIKQSLTGNGRGDKTQLRFMVERILGLSMSNGCLDESDALAVAICHAGRDSRLEMTT